MALYFEVDRADLRRTRWFEAPTAADQIEDGQLAVRVVRFALTANNITYGLLGDRLQYWQFFPAEPGWGRIPAWGVGVVTASRHPAFREGERLFGYLPMGTSVSLQPGRVGRTTFSDASPHRSALNPAYNFYLRLSADPAYDPAADDPLSLLRPLVMTGLVASHYLLDEGLFGAKRLALGSASSKTALATAFLLGRDPATRPELIALTSPANAAFCRDTGLYDRVLLYTEIPALERGVATAYLDMSGSAAVREAIHGHLAEHLTYSGQVGFTHWSEGASNARPPGVAPTFFSSLEHIRRRNEQWGPAGFEERMAAAWQAFLPLARRWIRVLPGTGRQAVDDAYQALVEGTARPEEGRVLSL